MSNPVGRVVIGVDPHKLSATIEVLDQYEDKLGAGRFTTDHARPQPQDRRPRRALRRCRRGMHQDAARAAPRW